MSHPGRNVALLATALAVVGLSPTLPASDPGPPRGAPVTRPPDTAGIERTLDSIRVVAMAVETYSLSTNVYPPTADIVALVDALTPTHSQCVPFKDQWGNRLVYASKEGRRYRIVSAGRDGRFEEADPFAQAEGTAPRTGDIVFENGGFRRLPEASEDELGDEDRQKRTLGIVRSVATASEAYSIDENRYPETATLAELARTLAPTYIRELPTADGWNHALVYVSRGGDALRGGAEYRIVSPGRDGRFETRDPFAYVKGTTTTFDEDIVFATGFFLRAPAGQR